MPQHGVTVNTAERIILDAGALYRDYALAGQELIGATRGGAEFTVERVDRDIPVDGAKGPIKDLKRTITHMAMLTATLVEVSQQTFLDLTRGSAVSDGTHRTITPDNAIVSGDYYTNISLVAEVIDTTDPIILQLLEALNENEWSITTDDQNEGELGVTFRAHYDPSDLDTPPYLILLPVNAS